MSLSQAGTELRRAGAKFNMPTGGSNTDVVALQADEDRIIRDVDILKFDDTNGVVELSFSSDAGFSAGNRTDNARSSVVAMGSGHEGGKDDLNLEWSAGEEIHIHTRNNTGATINAAVVLYYEESE